MFRMPPMGGGRGCVADTNASGSRGRSRRGGIQSRVLARAEESRAPAAGRGSGRGVATRVAARAAAKTEDASGSDRPALPMNKRLRKQWAYGASSAKQRIARCNGRNIARCQWVGETGAKHGHWRGEKIMQRAFIGTYCRASGWHVTAP